MPGEHRVRRGGRRLAQLRGHVVVAARRGEHQRGAPLDRPGERLVGRGVAGVQREHHLGRRVEDRTGDGPDHELSVDPELGRDRGVVLPRLLLDVDTGEPHREPLHVAEEPVGGEGQVGVAAAEVDDPQRVLGGRPAQVALLACRGDGAVEQPEELLDLAHLGLTAGLDPALAVGQPERPEQRVVGREQPLLVAVVSAFGLDRLLALLAVHDGLVRLGHPQLVRLASWSRRASWRTARPGGASTGVARRRPRPRGCGCAPAWRRTS